MKKNLAVCFRNIAVGAIVISLIVGVSAAVFYGVDVVTTSFTPLQRPGFPNMILDRCFAGMQFLVFVACVCIVLLGACMHLYYFGEYLFNKLISMKK